jgi:hypothetical protein
MLARFGPKFGKVIFSIRFLVGIKKKSGEELMNGHDCM